MRSRIVFRLACLLAFLPASFAQVQLIQDGGFEAQSTVPWVFGGAAGLTIASRTNPNGGYAYDGARYLSMGNLDSAIQSAYQTVTFPTNLIAATLSLYYQVATSNPSRDDTLTFYILDTNQIVLVNLHTATSSTSYTGYSLFTTNLATYQGSNTLSAYAGQTVELYFYVTTDPTYGYLTSFDIDDVSLLAGTTANIPSNDNLSNAIPIIGGGITNSLNTLCASKEAGEPNHAGNAGGHSAWWTWTAPAIGAVSITTAGSGFETLLAVYTNANPADLAFSNLTSVYSNNGATRSSGLAALNFNVATAAQVGTTYYIAVDGYNGQDGSAVFNFTFTPDTTLPTARISSPANHAIVTNSSVLVQGTANDNVAVASVKYSLANAAGVSAWQLAGSTNQWTNWSATVTNLIPGTNTVTVEALDTSTNLSAPVSYVFNYETAAPLSLSTVGQGSILDATTGRTLTNGQMLNLGYAYKIKALAAAGFSFTSWTGNIATNSATLSFTMTTNLSFTAIFADVQRPTLSLLAPTAGQRWSNSLFQISAKAGDNAAVAAVYYQLNGGAWTRATNSNGWTNWTADVILTPGSNSIRTYAVDTSGNTSNPTNSASLFYVLTTSLAVQTNGRGAITPNYNGQYLAIGSNYSMTAAAVPGSGFAFTNWTGNFPTNKAKLNFLMASNLTLVANFVDVAPPSALITFPSLNQRWSNSALTVLGTAKDNVAVAEVWCQLNSNGWSQAALSNGGSNWTAGVSLARGPNTVQAYSVDTSGNLSPTNRVSFLYVPSATLTVQTNGSGGITPVDDGKLLAIGTNYTLTASAGNNWLFSNWVGGTTVPYTVLGTNLSYTFPMQSNQVVEANFVTNLFLAAQGAYNGLFAPAVPPRRQTNSGSFAINVTSHGVLSGSLVLGGQTNRLSGQFDLGGSARLVATPHGQSPLTITLQLNLPNQSVQGTVTDGAFVAILNGDQSVFSASHPASNYQGQYTLIIPGTNDPTIGPFGASYGTVKVDALGNITFGGNLADGTTAVSQSSAVSKDGNWPFYLPLDNGAGSLWGTNYLTNHTIVSASFLSWIHGSNANSADIYRAGFTNEMTTVAASLYISTNKPLLNLTGAQVILAKGNLPFDITNQITLASNGVITVPRVAGNTNGLTLTITPGTGLISGSFLNPSNSRQTIKVNGVLLQNQTNAQGYFLGTNQSGTFLLETP